MKDMQYMQGIAELRKAIVGADAIVVGAGAGLSTAAGLTSTGRFPKRAPLLHAGRLRPVAVHRAVSRQNLRQLRDR